MKLKQKQEALKRMRLMGLMPNIIKEFERDGLVYYSENNGILYWLSNNSEWVGFVKQFEEKHNALVYHAEFSKYEFGDCLSLFYISSHEEEWGWDIEDIINDRALCYVWNIDSPDLSEFGGIGFKMSFGGVKRVW